MQCPKCGTKMDILMISECGGQWPECSRCGYIAWDRRINRFQNTIIKPFSAQPYQSGPHASAVILDEVDQFKGDSVD